MVGLDVGNSDPVYLFVNKIISADEAESYIALWHKAAFVTSR